MSDDNQDSGQGQRPEQQGAAGQGAQQQQGQAGSAAQGQQGQAAQGQQGAQQQDGAAATLAGGGAADAGKAPPTALPENWRALAAGEDKDVLALMERYKSLGDVGKALKDMRAELSKKGAGAKTAEPPGKDARPEEWAEWRKAQGIPEKPEDYGNALALPEGMVLGDADKPIAESFFKAAHAANMPQAEVNKALNWYFEHAEAQQIARADADDNNRQAARAELEKEWGPDFKRNINVISATLAPEFARYGEDLFAQVLTARLPDGTLLGDHAGVSRALVDIGLAVNPASRITPADSRNAMKSIGERKVEIETMMRDKPDAYFGNEAVQKEYRDLLEAEGRLSARRAA